MRVALLTFTRDRLAYTKHCFASLDANAGCDFDHYVLDQHSTDGTVSWLADEWQILDREPGRRWPRFIHENVGICRGANLLLDSIPLDDYDVIVRYDNDCEVPLPGTLHAVATTAREYGAIVAPRVLGLNNPPPTIRTVSLGGQLLDETQILGGIFMAMPAFLFTEHGFRYDERNPKHTGDEAIVPWWRAQGGVCGYLKGWSVNHYLTTAGQETDSTQTAYRDRRTREMAA